MRRVDYIITDIRRISRNEANPDGTLAITDEEVLQYINDAQDRLQGLICAQRSTARLFVTEAIIPAVANQDGYSIPDRVFYNKGFQQIEFSASGAITDYVKLNKLSIFNRDTNSSTAPNGYYIQFNKFYPVLLTSTSAGSFRVLYERTLDDIDKRRGGIDVVTGTYPNYTSVTLDSTADETSTPNLNTIDYVSICDQDGNPKAYKIPIDNYNAGLGVLNFRAGYAAGATESISVGDHVVFGQYATTHSKLPDECERYLIHYAVDKLLHKDSSDDMDAQVAKLELIEKDILKAIATQTAEVVNIPQKNPWEWW